MTNKDQGYKEPTNEQKPDVAKPVGQQGESRPEDKGRPAKDDKQD